jgi:putative DNA-invertase from lambdoid prophage Rac
MVDVCIYCRVSTEDQNVKQQVDYLKNYCKKLYFTPVIIVKDTESGRLPLTERKQFKKLLDNSLVKGLPVLVYNLDRLTRNWDDVTFIEKHFRDNWERSRLISSSDVIDLSTASGRMMFRIRMAVNCYMPEDMREKQQIGIERARKEGKYKGGKVGRRWV